MTGSELLRLLPYAGSDTPTSSCVLISRAHLSRNITRFAFPHQARAAQLDEVWELAVKAAEKVVGNGIDAIQISTLDAVSRNALYEGRLLGRELSRSGEHTGQGLVIHHRDWAITVNGEDHLRLQSIVSGAEPKAALLRVARLENSLGKWLPYAHSPTFGFLSSSPTNLGYGLRGSVLVSLCASRAAGCRPKVLRLLNRKGFTVQRKVGERNGAAGDLFQINTRPMGWAREEAVAARLETAAALAEDAEAEAAELLTARKPARIMDDIWRAWGILCNARQMGCGEALALLSCIRLGCLLEEFDSHLIPELNRLTFLVRPAILQLFVGRKMNGRERAQARADVVARVLTELRDLEEN